MTDFGWWAAQAPPGTFMCCLCFENKPVTLANRNKDGDLEDVCIPCADHERRMMEAHGRRQ